MRAVRSGEYDVVGLDEILDLVELGAVDVEALSRHDFASRGRGGAADRAQPAQEAGGGRGLYYPHGVRPPPLTTGASPRAAASNTEHKGDKDW